MDVDERQRKHDAASFQAGNAYRRTATSSDRFRQPPIIAARDPTSAPSTHQRSGSVPGYEEYGYTEHQSYTTPAMQTAEIQGEALQYQPDYTQEQSRQQAQQTPQQQQQQFAQYGQNMVYGMAQQASPHSPYETVPQYQSRQSAAVDSLSNHFAVPQYFAPGEPTSAGVPAAHTQYLTSQIQPATYPQESPTGRATIAPSFPASMAEFSSIGSETLSQQEFTQDVSGYDDAYNAAYNQYQQALKQTFENTRDGRLVEASQSLLDISEWLLGHAQDLGLDRDEEELHGDRIKLWDEFNTCWLAVLQKQKDLTREMLETGQQPRNILHAETLERMGRELVRLCDRMERHGLVDYQMGVWEEEIIGVLIHCLELLEGGDDPSADDEGEQSGPTRT